MAARCTNCRTRDAQIGPVCRTCEREAGIDTRSVFEFERDRQERQRQRLAQRHFAEQPPPRAIIRTLKIRGRLYDVTWDGSIR